MIELRYFVKLDGTTELQYRRVVLDKTDRNGLQGYAHFTATPWVTVPVVKEAEHGRS